MTRKNIDLEATRPLLGKEFLSKDLLTVNNSLIVPELATENGQGRSQEEGDISVTIDVESSFGRGRGRQIQGRDHTDDDIITRSTGKGSTGKGSGGKSGGNGGHDGGDTGEDVGGNNLSFATIWAEDVKLALRGTFGSPEFVNAYDGNGDGIPDEIENHYWYPQKDENNTWQAENKTASELSLSEVEVDWIDITDSLEVVDWMVGRPVRLEWVLYKELDDPMESFTMKLLEGEGKDEVQGTNGVTYENYQATVYSPYAELTIQPIFEDPDGNPNDIIWEDGRWIDSKLNDNGGISEIGDPIDPGCSFGSEINGAGKTIYGTTQGSWKPKESGNYRVTFSLPLDGNTQLDKAKIVPMAEEEIADELLGALSSEDGGDDPGGTPGGGTGVVVGKDNLTYIDIYIQPRSGGGGGGKKPHSDDLAGESAVLTDAESIIDQNTQESFSYYAIPEISYTSVGSNSDLQTDISDPFAGAPIAVTSTAQDSINAMMMPEQFNLF